MLKGSAVFFSNLLGNIFGKRDKNPVEGLNIAALQ